MGRELDGKVSRRGFLAAAGTLVIAGAAGLAGCAESRSQASSATESASSSSAASETASSSSAFAAASETASSSSASAAASSSASASSESSTAASAIGGKAIVCCFSHVGENYGVGYITEGNTEIVAKMIAEQTGADLFMIEPVEDYPQGYDECCDVALEEQNADARPAVRGVPDNWDTYDTVYLGYPIWWGDMPQCLYTFVEQIDWSDKDVHPFNTHAGSGTASVPATLRSLCAGATVGDALAIAGTTAQNSRDETRDQVEDWLA